MASGTAISCKAYDIRIACGFAIANLEEELTAAEESFAAKVRHRLLPEVRFVPPGMFGFFRKRRLTEEEGNHFVSDWVAKNYEPPFEKAEALTRLKLIERMAKYTGDNTVMKLGAEDFELLEPNLRGV